jgi:hypothetical protein
MCSSSAAVLTLEDVLHRAIAIHAGEAARPVDQRTQPFAHLALVFHDRDLQTIESHKSASALSGSLAPPCSPRHLRVQVGTCVPRVARRHVDLNSGPDSRDRLYVAGAAQPRRAPVHAGQAFTLAIHGRAEAASIIGDDEPQHRSVEPGDRRARLRAQYAGLK